MTLVPPSITTCPGQTVMFNCTANGIPIRWNVFTPNMNYTNLEITDIEVHRESMDGVIMADLIALNVSIMPITVVSSLTVNITREVECIVQDSQLMDKIERINQDSFMLQVIIIFSLDTSNLSVEVKNFKEVLCHW